MNCRNCGAPKDSLSRCEYCGTGSNQPWLQYANSVAEANLKNQQQFSLMSHYYGEQSLFDRYYGRQFTGTTCQQAQPTPKPVTLAQAWKHLLAVFGGL